MALLNPTFILGVVVLLYLLSFVLFAVIRIITGLSIQRIGYFSLRRLAFVPRDGLKIEVRSLGLNIHRPTFSQPTWLSIVVKELVVTVDSSELERRADGRSLVNDDEDDGDEDGGAEDDRDRKYDGNDQDNASDASGEEPDAGGYSDGDALPSGNRRHPATATLPRPSPQTARTSRTARAPPRTRERPRATAQPPSAERSQAWQRLTKLKERIKRLHRNVHWLRMIDVVATDSAVAVVGVGNVQFGSFTVAVDTRRKTVDRDRFMFRDHREPVSSSSTTTTPHKTKGMPETGQAEWIMTLRSVLLTPDGSEPMELVDTATLNIVGYLYGALDGLHDASIALKLGRLHIPYDDLEACAVRYRALRAGGRSTDRAGAVDADPSLDPSLGRSLDPIAEAGPDVATDDGAETASWEEDALMQTVADSKEFVSSILRGIKEVQFAVSFLGIAKKVQPVQVTGAPVLDVNVSMKEIGVDLHRLDSRSPAHRMYFLSKDIAHEALAAALSISVGIIDERFGRPKRVMYIPMATTTVRTTLPSKTVEITKDISAEERNANILFANSVVTSPSVDLSPRHLPLLLAVLSQPRSRQAPSAPSAPSAPTTSSARRHMLISRLLPKANIKFSMHEPVVRIALPPVNPAADPDGYDLLISSISSISLDIESFHSAVQDLHYSLAACTRLQTHNLYYQTSTGSRFDLLETESLDLKAQLRASPDVHVVASGNLQTFSVQMVRPEISDGLRQIVNHLRPSVEPDKKKRMLTEPKTAQDNFLRGMPAWLLHFHMQASDFSMQVAGVDKEISDDSKGVAVQLEMWTVEYRAQRLDGVQHHHGRRRAASRTVSRNVLLPETDLLHALPAAPTPKRGHHSGDGRRITFHGRGLEALIVESSEKWESEPFVHVPRFEVALSTLSDHQGRVLHIHSHVRTMLVHYSLPRHYCVGVATTVLRRSFMRPGGDTKTDAVSSGTEAAAPTMLFLDVGGQGVIAAGPASELISIDVKVALLQIKADMPSDPPLMLQIHALESGRHRWSSPFCHWKLIRLHAEAPRMPRVWARLLSIKNGRLDSREVRTKLATGGLDVAHVFDVSTDAIRFAVPHEMVLYRIFDNIINVFKCVLQLHHRFKTGTDEYILGKAPEGPKRVPRVSLRCRTFAFELEDGAFEWKLGMIYRVGRVEQMQRLAREEAFRVKVKKIHEEEARREASKFHRPGVPTPRGRAATQQEADTSGAGRSRSDDRHAEARSKKSHGDTHGPGHTLRYDPENSTLGMTGQTHISVAEAQHKLNVHNARGWKQRIDRHYLMARNGMREIRGLSWGAETVVEDVDERETILGVPDRPALMATLIEDLHVVLDKPSFPMKDLPEFLHKVGKGMPKDMLYTLLVPMNVQVRMGELKISLRDYPLPLMHVPSIAAHQSPKLHALALSGDFVIAEEFQGPESVRHTKVDILPAKNAAPGASKAGSFAIDVRRTTSQVKSYADLSIDINTALPTEITWGPSYQPAIQDMMMVMESFTKPQLDPSESVGFWDKIRLSFHTRIRVAWQADGNVHLALKGTRDPYQVTGNGAGFLMCWRNDVRWNIHAVDDPKRFMTVDSGEYVLAIPDYSHHAREFARQSADNDSVASEDTIKSGAAFKKVVMKLSGKVQWMAGLVFERAIVDGQRSFDFAPHYSIFLKAPQYARAGKDALPYDAFRGFRSQHIHMSIAVHAPADREWRVSNSEPSRSYNTVHLSPRFFTHFYAWWSLFSGPMSLPIRQGQLWPGCAKSSKKFGRHLATIKYNLLLAPLFLSHIYKHREADLGGSNNPEYAISATGLKVRFDSFMLDLHQRREEFNTRDKGRKTQSRTTGMKIHACQLDLASADFRAVSASIRATTVESIHSTIHNDELANADISRFTIPDDDFSWIDMDDFVELDWILPTEPNPDTKILPMAYAPRITYFRQTDIGGVISGDPDRTSPFGHEPTHLCIMTQDDDPYSVQMRLVRHRLDELEQQIGTHARDLEELLGWMQTGAEGATKAEEIAMLSRQSNVLKEKKLFLEQYLQKLEDEAAAASTKRNGNGSSGGGSSSVSGQHSPGTGKDGTDADADADAGAEFASEFTNRFVVHNMKLKWNNMLRNIVMRYSHQVSQRRGFVYYLSRPAVKFILDIVEEQQMKLRAASSGGVPAMAAGQGGCGVASSAGGSGGGAANGSTSDMTSGTDWSSTKDIEDRIRMILQDGKKFVNSDSVKDGGKKESTIYNTSMDNLTSAIAAEYTPQNSYHVRLIAPQIQLQSDKNKKHVVLVTAKGMELKVVEVMDKARLSDTVSGLVQRRFLAGMDSTQFFVTHRKWFSTRVLSLYSGTGYGSPSGSSWPPWVPVEAMFDFETDPFGFKRVVQKTSAMLRYDRYNTLRLKYTDDVNIGDGAGGGGAHVTTGTGTAAATADSTETRMDNLWVDFPQAHALCNSSQYYAIYVIVLDLLMYSEPLEKTRSERLEKIMLASDFSDLRGAPEMVVRLQERVRQLLDIKTHFQINAKYLDQQGWEERLALERDLAACEDELFFLMKAITTSQARHDVAQSNALLKWSISAREIVWHLIRDNNEPLVEMQLKDVEYDRTDNADGSHINLIQVGKILGWNLLKDAIYPEMIAPYTDAQKVTVTTAPERGITTEPMVRVYWYMLEAVAGITVMDHFEVTLFPMKIQLEHEVGKKIFEYIFPGSQDTKFGGGSNSSNSNSNSTPNGPQRTDSPFVLRTTESSDADTDGDGDGQGDRAPGMTPGQTVRLGSAASEQGIYGGSDAFSTRAGSLELRLRPTLTSNPRAGSADRSKGLGVHASEAHSFRFFRSATMGAGRGLGVVKKPSHESLKSLPLRIGIGRSSTGFSSQASTNTDGGSSGGGRRTEGPRFVLRSRTGTGTTTTGTSTTTTTATDDKQAAVAAAEAAQAASDDLTKMIARANNYMTFAYIRLPSVVLCLSYKGKGERNLEDVHDFVLRLPTIEYRNKTWSNLDLALALKSQVIKALISHTGAIIGNKISKHRPNTAQQRKLRELATSSVLLSTPALLGDGGSGESGGSVGGGGRPGTGWSSSRQGSMYSGGDDASSRFGGTSTMDYSRSPPRSLQGSQSSLPQKQESVSRSSSVTSSNRSAHSTLNRAAAGTGTESGLGTGSGTGPSPAVSIPKLLTTESSFPSTLTSDTLAKTSRPLSRSGSIMSGYLRPDSRGSMGGSEKKRSALGGVRNRLSAFASRVKEHNSSSGGGTASSVNSANTLRQVPTQTAPLAQRLGTFSHHGGNSRSTFLDGAADDVRLGWGPEGDETPVIRRHVTSSEGKESESESEEAEEDEESEGEDDESGKQSQ